ncbi:type I-E CRISPR-associated protein Cse2/CasB [Sinosporangium siamense]|uniref:Type I-E CRISPR-associated protein Cse2/CasB n=1 Tax=Sinosporangium siamense TaxID=1367973 RepID=A0A919RI97_9ACTN|nr:type I-E CRISPR-associated protein Cse2/CasB [Sinosporangium siamense]GII94318.1 type I-E CRISPR-associated protein Cse2/CasB [Sinosporangium siamense]
MSDPHVVRRDRYVNHLLSLGRALRSPDPRRAAAARQALARLRHSFTEGRRHQAYEVVFQQDTPPTAAETEVWLLVGGLFGLHPLPWGDGRGPRSIGASMGRLHKKQGSPAVARRLTQLLSRDKRTLPHHLRQTVRLLSAHDVPVHYGCLLDDLVVLLGDDHRGDGASRVRLKWAQEFHMPVSAATSEPPTTHPEATE